MTDLQAKLEAAEAQLEFAKGTAAAEAKLAEQRRARNAKETP